MKRIGDAWRGWLHRMVGPRRCADCGDKIGNDSGPKDGWQLEDGRTVCQACCVADTKRFAGRVIWHASRPNVPDQRPPTRDVGLAEGAIGGSLHPVVGQAGKK